MSKLFIIFAPDKKNKTRSKDLIHKIADYMKTQPITKAWLFGSFSRGEETENSDVDILVSFDETAKVGLLRYARIERELSEVLGRSVDLVEDGSLLPFVAETANRDKIMIYERETA